MSETYASSRTPVLAAQQKARAGRGRARQDQAVGLLVLICRPGRTYPHDEQAVCERLAAPQLGHSVVCDALMA
jgi:hypothetical protein